MTQGSRDSWVRAANPSMSIPETQVLPRHPAHKVCPEDQELQLLTGQGIIGEQNTQL